jgi:hypothetical protein
MKRFTKLLAAGIAFAWISALAQSSDSPYQCPCDGAWQAAYEFTPHVFEINFFNGMLRRDEVASQGTILWWSLPDPEASGQRICLKARSFRDACDLIVGIPDGDRCIGIPLIDPIYFHSRQTYSACKESLRELLEDVSSLSPGD